MSNKRLDWLDVGYLTFFELREATTVPQQTRDRAYMIRSL